MPQAMFDDADGALAMLRDSVETFAAKFPGPAALRTRRAAGGDIDRATWAAMSETGWTALMLPEHLGGSGLGAREQAVLSEALGRALVSEPLAMAGALSCKLVAVAPQSAEAQRLGAGIAAGTILAAPALPDAAAPLRARAAPDGAVLEGRTALIDAPRAATDFLVVGDENGAPLLASVPADAAGLVRMERPAVDGAVVGSLNFTNCRIPGERILARGPALRPAIDVAIAQARIALAAELAGIAAGALERTIAYTRERIQFGKPIASFQAIQHRLVDMWMDAEFACASVVNAVECADASDARARDLAVYAAKARAGESAVSIARRCVHLHGAMGFTDECDIGLFLKRAIALNATLGQPEALRLAFVERERAA